MKSRGRQGHLPEDMPREQMTKRWFAKIYGFTEDMTDSLSLEALEWWPLIETAESEVMRIEQEQQARLARRAQR